MGTTAMDVTRVGYAARRRRRRWIGLALAVTAVAVAGWGVSLLEPAPPAIDRDTVYFGVVQRGPMLRQVRGHGTLEPLVTRWIPARTRGRVERVLLRPGARVEPDTPILVLSNPEVERAALDSRKAMDRAEAEFASLEVTLGSDALEQQARTAGVEADYVEASLRAEAERQLADEGLLSELQAKISVARSRALATRHEIARERLGLLLESNAARLDAKRAEIEQHRALAELRAGELRALTVTAGIAGVVQQIPVEAGQEVGPGTNLALVAEPSRLQAAIRIPATQAREVRVGQIAHVDTRNGVVDGRVARVDPAVRQGTVVADVEIDGDLPEGARPDMSVEGRIDIEVLDDVLFVDRPSTGGAMQLVELFRVDEDGEEASRVPVRLGRASVRHIEIVEGLAEGDEILVSDTRRWDEHRRVRFK